MLQYIWDLGYSETIYNLFFVFGFIGVFSYLISVCGKYDIPKWKTVVFTILVYGSSYIWMFFLFWVDSGFKIWGGNNIVRVFWWLGVFTFLVAKLLKLDYWKSLDFVSPCLCINHGIAHLGCMFAGCCHGYPMENGLYNPNLGYKCFPTQPIEACAALLIAFFIARREKKKGYGDGIDGLSFPIMLMLFGYSRFFFEFLRDNEKLFWGISGLALHALLNGVIGTISFFLIKKHRKPEKTVVNGI